MTMDGWKTITACPNCNSGNLAPHDTVYTAPYVHVNFCNGILPVVTPTRYVKCQGCGLVIQSPRMTDERISYFYSSGAYRDTLGLSVDDMDRDELKRAGVLGGWLLSQKIYPERHLDIGCSRGYFLLTTKAAVKHGYDNNPSWSESHQVFNDKSQLETYDLVTAIHVLEHTIDPRAELAWYASLTTDLLLIEVPGEKTRGGPLRFAHTYYFPPAVLVAMIEAAGLRIVATETEPNTRVLARKVDK
jgi:hypothetical protein